MKKAIAIICLLCFACSNTDKVEFKSFAQVPVKYYDKKLETHKIALFKNLDAKIPIQNDIFERYTVINETESVINTQKYRIRFHQYDRIVYSVKSLLKKEGIAFERDDDMLYYLFFKSDENFYKKLNSNHFTYTLSEFILKNGRVEAFFNSDHVSCFMLRNNFQTQPIEYILLYIDVAKNIYICAELSITHSEIRNYFKKVPVSTSEKEELEIQLKKTESEFYKILANLSIDR